MSCRTYSGRTMITRVFSGAIQGVDAYLVQVEVDLIVNLPQFNTVGLAEGAVKESKERVRSAIKNAGFMFPAKRITVNLAPADMKKAGTAFDLPIAVGILLEVGVVAPDRLNQWMLAGELSLDGQLRPVRGALPLAIAAQRAGLKGLILPEEGAGEAAVVEGVEVRGARDLRAVVEFLNGESDLPIVKPRLVDVSSTPSTVDMGDVMGQAPVKRALEVAAAGGHNVLLLGPPGSGKSMLARRLTTILPAMSFDEQLETSLVYSVMGLIPPGRSLVTERPFRAPHHTISDAGLVGGGTGPSPGEVSLAHHGVLFLDEMPEFRRQSLEVLRQPLEDGHVTLVRARGSITYPARFMLVATMNPCPCGYAGDRTRTCSCSLEAIFKYRGRISGPLLDRIDLHVEVPALSWGDLSRTTRSESSADIRVRVEAARRLQLERLRKIPHLNHVHNNAQLPSAMVNGVCDMSTEANSLMEKAVERLGLSARGFSRLLKVARTIADLEGSSTVALPHMAEAVQYRGLDRSPSVPRRAQATPSPALSA